MLATKFSSQSPPMKHSTLEKMCRECVNPASPTIQTKPRTKPKFVHKTELLSKNLNSSTDSVRHD